MKKILIAYGAPYCFHEAIVPLIPELVKKYKVFILLSDFYIPKKVLKILELWKAENMIEGYLIVPNFGQMLKLHLFMRSKIKTLSEQKFDIFLSSCMMLPFERYLLECIIPQDSLKICFCPTITYLLERKDMVINLLNGSRLNQRPTSLVTKRIKFLQSLFIKIKNQESMQEMFKKAAGKIWLPVRLLQAGVKDCLDRFILPSILSGKTFSLRKHDLLTQLGTDQFNHIIFCDEAEANAHAALLGNPNMHVAAHPAQGNCHCSGAKHVSSAVLSPLSSFVGSSRIPEKYLGLFYRDMKNVLYESGAKKVHLRLHPRETGRWPYQLKQYLCQRGIEAEIVGSERPIHEIMCDYLGMAGFASSALRDARASCDFAFIVGFVGVSKVRYIDPKFVFGKSEGIGWIGEDGSYDSRIFIREKHIPPERKSVLDILRELSKE